MATLRPKKKFKPLPTQRTNNLIPRHRATLNKKSKKTRKKTMWRRSAVDRNRIRRSSMKMNRTMINTTKRLCLQLLRGKSLL